MKKTLLLSPLFWLFATTVTSGIQVSNFLFFKSLKVVVEVYDMVFLIAFVCMKTKNLIVIESHILKDHNIDQQWVFTASY